MTAGSAPDGEAETVVVLNPVAGSGDHREEVLVRAKNREYAVHETESEGDGVALARAAAEDGASTIVAAGGDGTLNEVVRGLLEAEALDRVTFGVVPCGTGNDFASNVGIADIEQAFEVLDHGERRRIDLGMADDRPFLNSCICGLTAEASAETTPELKDQLGTVAYVVKTARSLPRYEGVKLSVDAFETDEQTPLWSGAAVMLLVGNCRHFPPGGSAQADIEDGRLDVAFVEDAGTVDLVTKAAMEQLLSRDTERTVRGQAPVLHVEVQDDEPVAFSLDGEIIHRRRLSLGTRPAAVTLAVGPSYDPDPET